MKSYLSIGLILLCLTLETGYGNTMIIGEVVEIDTEKNNFTVKPINPNEPEITVKVGSADIQVNYLHKKIRGILLTEMQPPELQEIWPLDPKLENRVNEINLSHLKTPLTSNIPDLIKVGDEIPPFALYDQKGNAITDKDVIGKIIIMNFAFTRCCNPMACPTSTKKMVELQKMVEDQQLQDHVQFITITFNPENDTPGILNQYARGFGANPSNYSFLTGNPELIKRLTRIFGIYALSDKGMADHTMKTVIIDKRGKVIYEASKLNWEPKTFLNIIKKIQKV